MTRKILIASGKGGTGKSVFLSSLAETLSDKNIKTLIIESQPGLRCMDYILGLEDEMFSHYGNVLKGREDVLEAATMVNENLFYLPSPQTKKPGDYSKKDFEKLISLCEPNFDFILIDGPSGIGKDLIAASAGCEEVILITTLNKAAIRMAKACLDSIHKIPPLKSYVVLNKINKEDDLEDMLDVMDLFPSEKLGLISFNNIDTNKICERLLGNEVPLSHPTKKTFKSVVMRFLYSNK